MSFEKNMPVGGPVNKKEGAVSAKDLKAELAEDYKNFKDPNFYFPGGKSELEKAILEKEKQLLILENNINNVSAEGPVIKIEDQDSIENLKAELVEDYKNFKDPNFYFPGGKSEFEKLILEKENRLRSLEGNSIVNKLKVELKEDYNNFKDPNFYFPGGKSELEKSILEKEGKLRRGENMGRTGIDDSYEQSIKQSEEASPINPEMAIEENLGEGAEELSEPEFDLEPEVLLETRQDFPEAQQGLSEEELGGQPEDLNEQGEEQLEENQEQRGRVFEFINKHPKLKWAAAAIGVLMIGVGVGRIAEGAISDSKEIDKKEIVKPGVELDAPEIPVINIADEIIKDRLAKNGIDFSKLNPDVFDTIVEEVGFISGAETLDPGDGIGEITKTVENGFKNIMPGKTKVNLIDDQTGAIYRDQEASSILVHPGDIILENSDGEYFVIADKAGLNFKKVEKVTPADAETASKTTNVAEVEKQSAEQSGTAKSTETVKSGQPKVETAPAQAKADTVGVAQNKDGINLDNPIDLSEMVRNNKAEVKTAPQREDKSVDKTVSTEPKVKKGFWKRVFGGRDKK